MVNTQCTVFRHKKMRKKRISDFFNINYSIHTFCLNVGKRKDHTNYFKIDDHDLETFNGPFKDLKYCSNKIKHFFFENAIHHTFTR
jgi:hypothetical protein